MVGLPNRRAKTRPYFKKYNKKRGSKTHCIKIKRRLNQQKKASKNKIKCSKMYKKNAGRWAEGQGFLSKTQNKTPKQIYLTQTCFKTREKRYDIIRWKKKKK